MLVGISLCGNSWISRMDSVRKVNLGCEFLQELAMTADMNPPPFREARIYFHISPSHAGFFMHNDLRGIYPMQDIRESLLGPILSVGTNTVPPANPRSK